MDQRPVFDSKYLTGIREIDDEHRKFFEIAGRVYDSLGLCSDAASVRLARSAIDELIAYAKTHFVHEEALMQAVAYPELEAHRAIHADLRNQIGDMELRIVVGDAYALVDLYRFLCRWLVDHIQREDRKFGTFFAARM